MTSKASEELPVINLVRSFSILAVLAQHIGFNYSPTRWDWLSNLWARFSFYGMYGVTIFFLISGFLITRTLALRLEGLFQPNIRQFYVRRAGRLLPLLTIMVLLGALLPLVQPQPAYFASFFHSPPLPSGWLFWVSMFSFSFNWYMICHETTPYYLSVYWGVLWSLSVEEQFYIAYPFLLKWIKDRVAFTKLLMVLILIGPLVRWWAYQTDPDRFELGFMNSFGCFDLIALGALLYLCQEKWHDDLIKNKKLSWALVLTGAVIAATIYILISPKNFGRIYGPTLLDMAVFMFLLGAMNTDFFKLGFFNWLGLPGKFSYCIYLLHLFVIYCLWPWIPRLDVVSAFITISAIVTLLAFFSYYYFEMPANTFIRKYFGNGNES